MALNLVTAAPAFDWRRRARVLSARALGAALLTAAAVAAIPVFWLGLVLFFRFVEWVISFEPPPVSGALPIQRSTTLQVVVWIGSVAVYAAGLSQGRRLLGTGRHQVLFLRRFGFTPATEALTTATMRLGADWRSVTLDDQQIAPIGVSPGIRRAASLFHRATRLLLFLPLLFVLAYVGWLVFTTLGPPAEFESRPFTHVVAVSGYAMPALVFLGWELARARRQDRLARIEVRGDGDIPTTVSRAGATVRDAFGQRLLVVDVMDSTLWRRVVAAFAADAAVALIDVSEPSERVLWEISLLSTTLPRPCVFVAERSRAQLLATATDPLIARLHDLVAGRPVLTYRTNAIAEFAVALQGMLDQAVRDASPAPGAAVALPLDEDSGGPDEAWVRANLGRLVADSFAHYASQRPQRSRRPNTTVIDRYGDGTRRETTILTAPWIDAFFVPRDRWEVGDHETRLMLPKRVVDRYGRTVVLVTVTDGSGHTTWEVHLRTPGEGELKEVTTTVYRWAEDQPVTESQTSQSRFGTHRSLRNEAITRDAASVAAAARVVADLDPRFPARPGSA